MKKIEYEICILSIPAIPENEKRTVPGYLLAPGLGAHRETSSLWTLTHIPSGYLLGRFTTLKKTKMVALALAELGDWNVSPEILLADKETLEKAKRIVRIVKEEGR